MYGDRIIEINLLYRSPTDLVFQNVIILAFVDLFPDLAICSRSNCNSSPDLLYAHGQVLNSFPDLAICSRSSSKLVSRPCYMLTVKL